MPDSTSKLLKNAFMAFFSALRRKARFAACFVFNNLQSLKTAAHLTAMDGGNASGLQAQSAPWAARGLPKNGLSQQSANHARAAIGVLLLGLALVGNAGAAQRSLTDIISDSFEEAHARPADPAATPGDTGPVAVQTAAAATPIPLAKSYPSSASSTTHSIYDQEEGGSAESFAESVRRSIDGFHELVIPAQHLQAIPPADPRMDCYQLYDETTRLLALGQHNRPPYEEDPRNIVIGAVGVVFPPATYLLGVTAYAAWYEDRHQAEARHRAAELRTIMADRRCFARD